ncbi:sulfurtransferase [Flavobacterium sp. 3HN19-14]|uniref:sulfurtransferase n=1 Tax=Flavobacterium sp. 3HN19-14 TaxID=3448133 RepID=UPI003EE1AE4C
MDLKTAPLISVEALLKKRHDENLIIINAGNGKSARENYVKKHLDKALFVDLNTQLADIKEDAANGGRHPLPKIPEFAQTLGNLGISKNSHIVIYDDKNGANAAARFWWMLRAIGHENVQVLDGGLQQAEQIGFPMNDKIETPIATKFYPFDSWKLPTADINEVEENSLSENYVVVDVRENSRYRGINEPIDLTAGHIPGAVNIPFSTNLDGVGKFLHPDILRSKYETAISNHNPENIIVHCGSGVTACHTILAMDYAGLSIPKLYVGSWSEWSRNNKTIATEI